MKKKSPAQAAADRNVGDFQPHNWYYRLGFIAGMRYERAKNKLKK